MKDVVKSLVAQGPFESVARYCLRLSRKALKDIKSWTTTPDLGELYDRQTLSVMNRVLSPDSNCIDIGCHKGDILRQLLRLAPHGMHFAFEPLPNFFEALKNNFATYKNVTFHNCALSNATGTTSFQHVVSNPAYSGIKQRSYARPNEQIVQIEVTVDRLDNLVPVDINIEFVKIDVEGAELQVLQGAVQTLRRCKPVVVFEHGVGAADHYGTRPEQVFDLLCQDCEMQIYLMKEWLREGSPFPLDRDQFVQQFVSCENYYFMATSKLAS